MALPIGTPFILLEIEGKDATRLMPNVPALKVKDSVKKADLYSVTFLLNSVNEVDDPLLQEDNKASVTWGYSGGARQKRTGVIRSIEHNFGELIEITLNILDQSAQLATTESTQVWNDFTASEIAEFLAVAYQIKAEIAYTDKKYKALPQAGRRDSAFLAWLARENNRLFFIRNEALYFVEKGYGKQPVRSFKYNHGNGDLISFKPTIKTKGVKGPGTETTAKGFDPKTKKPVEHKASESNSKDEHPGGSHTSLGIQYGRNGSYKVSVETGSFQNVATTGKQDPKKEVEQKAKVARAQAREKHVLATAEAVGDPEVQANDLVRFENVGKKYEGNYLVDEVVHSVSGSGYTMTLNIHRIGVGKVGDKTVKEGDAPNKAEAKKDELGKGGKRPADLKIEYGT